MAVIGPGSVQDTPTDVQPMLHDATEYDYITVFNPLTDDFAVKVAIDVPINAPAEIYGKTSMTQTGQDVVRTYGLDLKNPDFKSKRHISNSTVIPAGGTVNLKGNEAQVAVRQLVNELLQREGKTRLMADPVVRHEAEQRIIKGRGSIQDLMSGNMQSIRQQADEAIAKSNEVHNEQPFPGLGQPAVSEDAAGSGDTGANGPTPQKRGPGRPRQTE